MQETPVMGRSFVSTVPLHIANGMLSDGHYLGPIGAARHIHGMCLHGSIVAVMVWRWPTARMIPSDGTWLELSRWLLTPEAGKNAGSWMMARAVRWIRAHFPRVRVLVSYSDPGHGHTGALYRACNWKSAPTHHELRWRTNGVGYPSGHGSWGGEHQHPKQRWTYEVAA